MKYTHYIFRISEGRPLQTLKLLESFREEITKALCYSSKSFGQYFKDIQNYETNCSDVNGGVSSKHWKRAQLRYFSDFLAKGLMRDLKPGWGLDGGERVIPLNTAELSLDGRGQWNSHTPVVTFQGCHVLRVKIYP